MGQCGLALQADRRIAGGTSVYVWLVRWAGGVCIDAHLVLRCTLPVYVDVICPGDGLVAGPLSPQKLAHIRKC